jgi:deoxyxylulose-5-phosphate synthase
VELNSGDTAIVSMGPVILELKDEIIKNNLRATLYNAIYLKPMDANAIQNLLKCPKIIIYDPYGTEKGFATYLSSELLKHKYKGEICIKAIPDVFVKHASIQEQRKEFGLLVEDIIKLL